MATTAERVLPAHVPSELAMDLPLFARERVYENPHETMIPELHATLPPIAYVTNIFPGKSAGWLLKRTEDVKALLQDSEHFIKRGMGKWADSIGEDWIVVPTEADPPIHSLYRRALNPQFSPQKMHAMAEGIRERARVLIETFKDNGECDFVNEFSEKYPILIVLDLLGLPQDRMQEFLGWEKDMLHTDDWDKRTAATRSAVDYLKGEIAARRANPREDDYLSTVFNYEIDGRKWNEVEILGHCFNLFLGGLDTVTSLSGLMFNFLAHNPAHQKLIRDNPSVSVVAVEEMLRAFGPVTSFRICSKEVEICGQKVMPGDYVAMSSVMAGNDPTYYDEPVKIDFDRRPAHLSLGGIHTCLGMHLARIELQIAIEEFVKAIPEFRIKDGFKVPYFVGNIVHIPDLQLQWN